MAERPIDFCTQECAFYTQQHNGVPLTKGDGSCARILAFASSAMSDEHKRLSRQSRISKDSLSESSTGGHVGYSEEDEERARVFSAVEKEYHRKADMCAGKIMTILANMTKGQPEITVSDVYAPTEEDIEATYVKHLTADRAHQAQIRRPN